MSNASPDITSDSPSASARDGSQGPAPVTGVQRVLRSFWLGERIASAKAQYMGPSQPGWFEYVLAIDARDAGEEIRESGRSYYAQLLLLKMQLLLLIRCHMKRSGLPLPEDTLYVDWAEARGVTLIDRSIQNLSAIHWAQIESMLGDRSDVYLTKLGADERAALAAPAKDLACALIAPIEREAGVVRRLRIARYIGLAAVLVVVFIIASQIFGWVMDKSGKVNLALHRPVTVSTQIPGAGTDHRLLVDGDHTNLGFHTEQRPNQFVVIDLGSSMKFDKVVVYNRADCCQERTIPLLLEASDDGVHYATLAERADEFDVWTASMLRAKGRYVRLRLLSNNLFHLSEVEIY